MTPEQLLDSIIYKVRMGIDQDRSNLDALVIEARKSLQQAAELAHLQADAEKNLNERFVAHDCMNGKLRPWAQVFCSQCNPGDRTAYEAVRHKYNYRTAEIVRDTDKLIRILDSADTPSPDVAAGEKCPECGGEDVIDSGGSTPQGEWINVPCPTCQGTGRVVPPAEKGTTR